MCIFPKRTKPFLYFQATDPPIKRLLFLCPYYNHWILSTTSVSLSHCPSVCPFVRLSVNVCLFFTPMWPLLYVLVTFLLPFYLPAQREEIFNKHLVRGTIVICIISAKTPMPCYGKTDKCKIFISIRYLEDTKKNITFSVGLREDTRKKVF